MKNRILTASTLALTAAASTASAANISYTGGTYSQNFDGLANSPFGTTQTQSGRGPHALGTGLGGSTGVDGWFGGNFSGSSANTEFRVQDGSLGSGGGRGVISFGAVGSSERAVGLLSTSNQISSVGAVLSNDTAGTLTSVTVSYFGEQWRRGNVATPNSINFFYGLNATIQTAATAFSALSFTGPNTQAAPTEVALNGNAAANRTFISATITGLNWTPGSTLALVWRAIDQDGQDDGLAIDDVSISAVPAPAALPLAGLGALAIVRRRRA